jgi:molybdopterin-guanine dinucleotide biosynthesis protein A
MSYPISAVILSGGLNSRMKGRNKALLKIDGQYILDRLIGALKGLFTEIVLVTRDSCDYAGRGMRVVHDIFKVRSSLTGIHAGLVNAVEDHAFFTACDTPFLKRGLVELLLEEWAPPLDAVVPTSGPHYQPLCAIYSKRCIGPIEGQLRQGDPKIIHFFDKVSLKKVPQERFKDVDPEYQSFFNINTPDDIRIAKMMASMSSS